MLSSILDNDFYKFTMQNAVVKLFPRARVKYELITRSATHYPDGFAAALRRRIDDMAQLQLSPEEKAYCQATFHYLDPTYLDFLSGYRYAPQEVQLIQNGGELKLLIEGYWYRTILWEVPLMALISELYFEMTGQPIFQEAKICQIANDKMQRYQDVEARVADFGTRRRYSFHNHDLVVKTLSNWYQKSFAGTSNVHLARKYKVSVIGTHAHEWFMFHSAKYGYKMANVLSLEHWVDIYRGDLGIALSDTFTTDIFYRTFDTKFAKLFDGVRHDSGNPIAFVDKTLAHYRKLNIDPASKTIIFSDSLTPDRVEEICRYCRGKIKISFGIGTNFTNDVGVTPLNIVIKMVAAKPEGQDWIPVIKLSDSPGKHTGQSAQIKLCKEVLAIAD